jgi:hypothetical protein
VPNLEDARACLARAQRHYREFKELSDPGGLWRITTGRDEATGEWFNRLEHNRARLVEAKPVLADSVTNAISALDHVAAAIAKANGHDRLRSLYFPLGLTEEAYEKACARTNGALGDDALRVLAEARDQLRANLPFIEAAKEISYSGKHWALHPPLGSALAVQVVFGGGGHKIFEMPADTFAQADAHDYYRGKEPLPEGHHSILLKLVVDGLGDGSPDSPEFILEGSFRFVQGIIDAVAGAGADEPIHTA